MSRRASFAEYRRAMDAAYGRWGPTPRYWLPVEDRIEETKYRYVRGWIDLPEMERIIDLALRHEEHIMSGAEGSGVTSRVGGQPGYSPQLRGIPGGPIR